jgi:hypothetical protein
MDDRERVRHGWEALQASLAEEGCRSCECLQGALTEFRLTLEDLDEPAGRDGLLAAIRRAQQVEALHGCRGCRPCAPSDILVAYYRAPQLLGAPGPCDCGPGCGG